MPRASAAARQQRNAAILRARPRASVRELALRYGLTERQVYNILATARLLLERIAATRRTEATR